MTFQIQPTIILSFMAVIALSPFVPQLVRYFTSKAAEEKKRREAKDKRDKEESSKVNEKINFGFLFLF